MGECGCPGMWKRYRFPGPKKSFYLLTLSGPCTNCDAPSGISIELCMPGSHSFDYYSKDYPDALDGELKFPITGLPIVAIVTGMDSCDFIRVCQEHLVGVRSDEMGENGAIDLMGAEVILEEMYEDACFAPKLVDDAE